MLSPAAGLRQLRRVGYYLALSKPLFGPTRRVRPPQLPGDAIVYLFSTLLDDESIRLALGLVKIGHQVIVIDVLPEVRMAAEVNLEVAWRVIRMERQDRIDELEAQHIPVIGWAGQARNRASARLAELRARGRRR
jgi:hypothetical protein